MNAPAEERPVCRCGTPMTLGKGKKASFRGLHYCPNCDTIQARELEGKQRLTTEADRAYKRAWIDDSKSGGSPS